MYGCAGDVLGYAEQVTKCCNCSSFIKVFDAANRLIYTLQGMPTLYSLQGAKAETQRSPSVPCEACTLLVTGFCTLSGPLPTSQPLRVSCCNAESVSPLQRTCLDIHVSISFLQPMTAHVLLADNFQFYVQICALLSSLVPEPLIEPNAAISDESTSTNSYKLRASDSQSLRLPVA